MRGGGFMSDFLEDFIAVLPMGEDPLNRAVGTLVPGDNIFSSKRNFKLSFQLDGNLVLYTIDSNQIPVDPNQATAYPNAIFATKYWPGPGVISNHDYGPADRCVMQTDGNLVIYNGTKPIWNTATDDSRGEFLRVQCDGNIVIYRADGSVAWHSNTYAGPH
jgi:hypothetical protein